MRDEIKIKIVQVAYHRNGIAGEGFHAVIFETKQERCVCGAFASLVRTHATGKRGCMNQSDEGHPPFQIVTDTLRMVATVFDGPGRVAVYQIDLLMDPAIGVRFGENSWRGDQYEDQLRQGIKTHKSDGSIKVGPFGVPT
jgi:hypothetical protein